VSFSLLLNLVSAANASDKAILWGFLSRYIPGATPETSRCSTAWRLRDQLLRGLREARTRPSAPPTTGARGHRRPAGPPQGPAGRRQDAELIQNEVFAVGKDHGFEPLRAWFGALYEVLLGQSQGPRFGSFAAIFGLDRTIALIEEKLAA
jgi:lysyl-tRNA synthetase class 1